MQQPFESHQFTDASGNPAGGHTFGDGFTIAWQNGPLALPADGEDLPEAWTNGAPSTVEALWDGEPKQDARDFRREPNGAFVETIIAAALDRLAFYQASKFACQENADAIDALNEALAVLHSRTAKRQARGVEGTHTP